MGVMNDTSARNQHLFIVRLWSEGHNIGPTQWRGSVEHIPSGQKFYFTSLSDMKDFISLHLSAPAQSLPNGKEKS